jgi:hypothetical protein
MPILKTLGLLGGEGGTTYINVDATAKSGLDLP